MRSRQDERKITIVGQPKDVQKHERTIIFSIVTGPSSRSPPRGLKLFGQTRYRVECSKRQWNRARKEPNDHSDLVIEGYLEPRRDEETGKLYIAVGATSVQSTYAQNKRKVEQLQQALEQARAAFAKARDNGVSREELEEKAAALVKANESYVLVFRILT